MRILRQRVRAFRFARQTITNRWKLARRCALSTERAKAGSELRECLWPWALCGMFLQSAQSFFREDRVANRIAFIWIDGYDLFAPSLTVGVLCGVSAGADKKSLHLPDSYAVFQLFREAFRIGGGVKRLQLEPRGSLMMAVVVGGHGVVRDDYVGAKPSYLQNHSSRENAVLILGSQPRPSSRARESRPVLRKAPARLRSVRLHQRLRTG